MRAACRRSTTWPRWRWISGRRRRGSRASSLGRWACEWRLAPAPIALGVLTGERDESHREGPLRVGAPVGLLGDDEQVHVATAPDGNHQLRAGRQLIHERLRNARRTRADDDPIERRVLGPSQVPIPGLHARVPMTERGQYARRALRQGLDDLDAVLLATQLGEQR